MTILSNAAIIGGVNILQTALFRQGRSIAGIIPNVVVEESHSDELTVTDHPVEQGASVSDHAFKQPAQVSVRYQFGESSLNLIGAGAGDPASVYSLLLKIQASRVPFDLLTGKRAYQNMLIKTLSVTTDPATENILAVSASLREVIIVQTSVTSLQPADAQANPEQTAAPSNTGTKQPQQSSVSLLYRAKASISSVLGL
jgi:hypothetical protein